MKVNEPVQSPLSGTITVRHAGSLGPLCAAIHKEFKNRHRNTEVNDIGGGGVLMAREMVKKNDADVYSSVDYSNIPNLLIPDFADWYFIFAATGFVLRYTDKSKYASEINTKNWIEIVQRDDVTFWRSNPEEDPSGYRSLMVFQLAEKFYGIPGLARELARKSGKQFLSASTLEERDKGYCFSYSSHLMGARSVNLPDQINLSNDAFGDYYRQASVTIPGLKPGVAVTMKGEPIRLGITIPRGCPNQELAVAWVHLLLSTQGRAIIVQAGQHPLKLIFGGDLTRLPLLLLEYVK